jgi:hypothetical protein
MSVLTLVYVLVTAFYACTAYKTLKAIRDQGTQAKQEAANRDSQFAEQLKVSKETAEAALLNARAVINSERPWIVVTPVSKQSNTFSEFEASNYGRTPAEIISKHSEYKIVERASDIPILAPESAPAESAYRFFLLPVQQVSEIQNKRPLDTVRATYAVHRFEMNEIWSVEGPQIKREVEGGIKKLVLYGIIVYADVLTKHQHYTRFCYQWTTSGAEIPYGPDEANAHS